MSCCSYSCPHFSTCRQAADRDGGPAVPYAEYGTGMISPGSSAVRYMCGPLGGYALYQEKEWSLFICRLGTKQVYIRCQANSLATIASKKEYIIEAFAADESCVLRKGPPLILKESSFTPCLWNPYAFALVTKAEPPFYILPEEKLQALADSMECR